jgi:hypothetical protein
MSNRAAIRRRATCVASEGLLALSPKSVLEQSSLAGKVYMNITIPTHTSLLLDNSSGGSLLRLLLNLRLGGLALVLGRGRRLRTAGGSAGILGSSTSDIPGLRLRLVRCNVLREEALRKSTERRKGKGRRREGEVSSILGGSINHTRAHLLSAFSTMRLTEILDRQKGRKRLCSKLRERGGVSEGSRVHERSG